MSLRDRLDADVKDAMRARDDVARDTLRMVISEIKKQEIDGDKDLDEPAVAAVVAKAAKTRQESLEVYEKAGRDDLAATERAQLAVLERYLPKQLSEDETRALVTDVIQRLGVTSKKDVGRVMKEVMSTHRGLVDGKRVQALASEQLD